MEDFVTQKSANTANEGFVAFIFFFIFKDLVDQTVIAYNSKLITTKNEDFGESRETRVNGERQAEKRRR